MTSKRSPDIEHSCFGVNLGLYRGYVGVMENRMETTSIVVFYGEKVHEPQAGQAAYCLHSISGCVVPIPSASQRAALRQAQYPAKGQGNEFVPKLVRFLH